MFPAILEHKWIRVNVESGRKQLFQFLIIITTPLKRNKMKLSTSSSRHFSMMSASISIGSFFPFWNMHIYVNIFYTCIIRTTLKFLTYSYKLCEPQNNYCCYFIETILAMKWGKNSYCFWNTISRNYINFFFWAIQNSFSSFEFGNEIWKQKYLPKKREKMKLDNVQWILGWKAWENSPLIRNS